MSEDNIEINCDYDHDKIGWGFPCKSIANIYFYYEGHYLSQCVKHGAFIQTLVKVYNDESQLRQVTKEDYLNKFYYIKTLLK